jgi:PPOX class probable F420-dependent enzyme
MMEEKIPVEFLDLFKKKAFGHLATVMPDGSPQISPLWVDYDGKYLILNSEKGRQKDRNMRRDARVAVEVQDPDNPYRYILVRGVVAEITEDGAVDSINTLSLRYRGELYKYLSLDNPRVIYKVLPLHVKTSAR